MQCIRKRVGFPAEVIDAKGDYPFLRTTVGGYIEYSPIGPGVDIVCNEEGMYAGPGGEPLPQNAAGFLGDIAVVATDDEGSTRSMTDEEVRKAIAYLERFADAKHPGDVGPSFISGTEAVMRALEEDAAARSDLWDSL